MREKLRAPDVKRAILAWPSALLDWADDRPGHLPASSDPAEYRNEMDRADGFFSGTGGVRDVRGSTAAGPPKTPTTSWCREQGISIPPPGTTSPQGIRERGIERASHTARACGKASGPEGRRRARGTGGFTWGHLFRKPLREEIREEFTETMPPGCHGLPPVRVGGGRFRTKRGQNEHPEAAHGFGPEVEKNTSPTASMRALGAALASRIQCLAPRKRGEGQCGDRWRSVPRRRIMRFGLVRSFGSEAVR